jgi:hypothetical protein
MASCETLETVITYCVTAEDIDSNQELFTTLTSLHKAQSTGDPMRHLQCPKDLEQFH